MEGGGGDHSLIKATKGSRVKTYPASKGGSWKRGISSEVKHKLQLKAARTEIRSPAMEIF